MYTDDIPNFDIYKNINVLENLCNKNNISFFKWFINSGKEKKR